eukprot:CAMPEP_0178410242 /NCGR_PEP_ID=MMETSP0689_2-20121128/20877_1 /TAXON_ID=160604 /ORGANISM="Amphidinium massartii, Strain CS-259" /LENGTH=85 /DNA_ID=CAMNT_0020031409 /DNA_START=565 /DNA_END=822 /DNA_ORIENTATION=+
MALPWAKSSAISSTSRKYIAVSPSISCRRRSRFTCSKCSQGTCASSLEGLRTFPLIEAIRPVILEGMEVAAAFARLIAVGQCLSL